MTRDELAQAHHDELVELAWAAQQRAEDAQREAEHENQLALQKVESNPGKDQGAKKPAALAGALDALITGKDVVVHYG